MSRQSRVVDKSTVGRMFGTSEDYETHSMDRRLYEFLKDINPDVRCVDRTEQLFKSREDDYEIGDERVEYAVVPVDSHRVKTVDLRGDPDSISLVKFVADEEFDDVSARRVTDNRVVVEVET